jgi:Flp pilus assembly protein TadD
MCRLLQPILDYEAVGTQEKVHPLMMHFLLPFAIAAQAGVAQPPDVDRLRAAARTAEARFERLTRSMAPQSWGGYDGRTCDEIVGRFCLRFDSTTATPAPVAADPVLDARGEAVEALRRYFSAAPAERRAAGPLVRLLILDGRPDEASSAAATFAALSPDTLWGHLLLGLAHHAAGLAEEAEREFVRALQLMDENTRREWTDPGGCWTRVSSGTGAAVAACGAVGLRAAVLAGFRPALADGANERWTEHMARHAEARLHGAGPVVAGMLRWGRDLDELTVRYGTPSVAGQIRGISHGIRRRSSSISTRRSVPTRRNAG